MLKKLRQRKPFRTFVWQSFNGGVTLLLAYLAYVQADIPAQYAALLPFVYSAINAATKYINTTYFGDVGVQK